MLQSHQGPFLTRGLLEDPAPYAPKPTGALFDQGPLGGLRALRSKTTRGALFDQGPLGRPRPNPQLGFLKMKLHLQHWMVLLEDGGPRA